MSLFPSLQTKQVRQLVPGELVRFRSHDNMVLAMAAGCDFHDIPSGMVLIPLEDLPGLSDTSLRFFPVRDSDMLEPALSYGTAHFVVVDPAAPVASQYEDRFRVNGALIVGASMRAVRCHAGIKMLSHIAIMVDIDTWKAVERVSNTAAMLAVLGWELRLVPDERVEPKPPPVYVFHAKAS